MKTYSWIPIDENIPKDRDILVANEKQVEMVFWGNVNENSGDKTEYGWCICNSYSDEMGGWAEFVNVKFYMEIPYP